MPVAAGELAAHTRPAELFEPLDGGRVRCLACGHLCPIAEGQSGVCKVRFNRGGTLYAPYGYAACVQCDPIEKKPFFHVQPGSAAFSFGMLGCSFHCGYCQNWLTSQSIRDPLAMQSFTARDPREMVRLAIDLGARSIVSTYNEPLITAEWAVAVFRHARRAGLLTGFVSNGNASPEVLTYLRPWLDAFKVDLKCFRDRPYRDLGGRLDPVLRSIEEIHARGFWLEIVTLLVPGFNDSDEELREMAAFLAGVSPDIPWHVTAFHPDYHWADKPATPPATLIRAVRIGREAGLRYVYAGNLPGLVDDLENTRCASCGALLIERTGFRVRKNRLDSGGHCPVCAVRAPGIWNGAVRVLEG
ncbi:MAG: AmmeMemoRadiSam system radical SAM enzyme [Bryobacterales bacterium]|nr:AmmeMemoRadiSam system radical SAM enzyme [Bryobacterales bacterium]